MELGLACGMTSSSSSGAGELIVANSEFPIDGLRQVNI